MEEIKADMMYDSMAKWKMKNDIENEDYKIALELGFMEGWKKAIESIQSNNLLDKSRFILPSDKQMIDIAILFNDGKLEADKLADMVGYGQFIVDRLYENGDVGKPSSKE